MLTRNLIAFCGLLGLAVNSFSSIEMIPDYANLHAPTYRQANQGLKKELLESPELLLKRTQEDRAKVILLLEEEYEKAVKENGDTGDGKLYSTLSKQAFAELSQAALSFVNECGDEFCANNRFKGKDSHMRSACEREIIQAAKTIAGKKKDVVNYVGFGSGRCFPDLLVVTQLLEQGVKKINFHAIDRIYEKYITYMQQQSLSGAPITAFSQVPADIWEIHTVFSQLSHWFAAMYPDATCRIFLHANIKDYKYFIEKEPHLIGDIVAGIDFDKECSTAIYMWMDFLSLLNYVFESNKNAIGFKDYCGFCVLKFSIPQLESHGFEAICSQKEKAKYLAQNHAAPWIKILFNQEFCTTGKLVKPFPIADHTLRGQLLHVFCKN